MPPDYTREEWMRGVPPPSSNPAGTKGYVYGVGVNIRDKLIPYVIRTGADTPFEVVRVLEEHEVFGPVSEANRLRNELLKKHEMERAATILRAAEEARKAREEEERRVREAEIRKAETGRVAAHSDGQAIHMAIVLDPGPETFALFLTTRPTWARFYRPLTRDEGALVGLRRNERVTFLAPVVRPRAEFSLTPRQFPESRIVELLREFPRMYAS